jgi:peptidoglycan/LPS O-acetylase OafA/YrhL
MSDQSPPALPAQTTIHQRNNLDFIRLFLAVLVIFSHSFPLVSTTSDFEPLDRLTRHGWDLGKEAVVGFFVISGFLVSQSWVRTNNLTRFIEKRSLRIFPGYIAAVAMTILLAVPAVGSIRPAWRALLVEGLTLQPLFDHSLLTTAPLRWYINGSIWTIRYEYYCYILVAALGIAGLLNKRAIAVTLFVASYGLTIAARIASEHNKNFSITGIGDLSAWARFLPAFLAGVVWFHFAEVIRPRFWHVAGAIVITVLLFRFGARLAAEMLIPPTTVWANQYVAFHPRIRLHNFGRFGDFSYGTYLYAWPIQQVLLFRCPGVFNPWTLFLAAAPVSVVAGVASWYAVERPLLKLKAADYIRGRLRTAPIPNRS